MAESHLVHTIPKRLERNIFLLSLFHFFDLCIHSFKNCPSPSSKVKTPVKTVFTQAKYV